MDTLASLNHSVWDCKYHVVFIPKMPQADIKHSIERGARMLKHMKFIRRRLRRGTGPP